MLRAARLPVLVLIFALAITALQTPKVAVAAFTWYGASLYNWSFTRADGTPLLFQQDTCYKCTASGTAAWYEYTWVAQGNNTHTPNPYPNGNQDSVWNWFANTQSWGSYANTFGDINVSPSCTGVDYPRSTMNVSKDDGADPYAQSWGIYWFTPPGYFYHEIRYDDGPTYTGYYTGTHSIGAALSQFQEPVGTFIGNGQHFVLTTAIEADPDPINQDAAILNVLIRDPLLLPGAFPYTGNRVTYAYDTGDTNSWARKFTRYGYTGVDPNVIPGSTMTRNAAPYTTGAGSGYVDDVEVGPNVSRPSPSNNYVGFWWGHYIAVKRDTNGTTPDSPVWWYTR